MGNRITDHTVRRITCWGESIGLVSEYVHEFSSRINVALSKVMTKQIEYKSMQNLTADLTSLRLAGLLFNLRVRPDDGRSIFRVFRAAPEPFAHAILPKSWLS